MNRRALHVEGCTLAFMAIRACLTQQGYFPTASGDFTTGTTASGISDNEIYRNTSLGLPDPPQCFGEPCLTT